MRLPVEWCANKEKRANGACCLPACPRTRAITEAFLDSQAGQQRPIEGEGSFKVRDADEDV